MHEDCSTSHYAASPNYLFEDVERGESNQASIPLLNKAMLLTKSQSLLCNIYKVVLVQERTRENPSFVKI